MTTTHPSPTGTTNHHTLETLRARWLEAKLVHEAWCDRAQLARGGARRVALLGLDEAWDWLEVARREYGVALGRAAVGRLAGSDGRGGVIGHG